ncbi:hypothetical protein [Microvirga calopogonii]|uniref:hypothetical protein n=1 Tax=Microvirga calopogonii TaxID=2078013 RepID=UPI000E0CFC7E|nr:hypothetical protein [Microvirga calopogonii]
MTTNFSAIEAANNLIIQKLAHEYLAPDNDQRDWNVEGAYISARHVGNRYGVPSAATTYRYVIEHAAQGWSLAFRAVWLNGNLMQPWATHVVIETYYADDTNLVADTAQAMTAASDWLQAVPL